MLPLELQPGHDQAIRQHGQGALPNECCGFLLGHDQNGVRRIVSVVPAINERIPQQQHNRFSITPEAYMKADKAAREQKLELLGFYHSHPNAPARPSQYDLDHAWPVYSYLIVSVRDGNAREMTSWVLRDDRSEFEKQSIMIAQPQEKT